MLIIPYLRCGNKKEGTCHCEIQETNGENKSSKVSIILKVKNYLLNERLIIKNEAKTLGLVVNACNYSTQETE